MKKTFKSLILFSVLPFFTQFPAETAAQIGKWQVYPAYQNATLVAETPNYVFSVYDGALLSFNPADNEVRTYSSQQGLTGTDIHLMVYNESVKALVLVYADSNIDLFYGENNVDNFPEIKNDNTIRDKTIYNVEIIDDNIYLSTAFGIVVIDPKKNVIKDTYRLGYAVRSVCKKGAYLYAATGEGIKKAQISSNLLDRENWLPWDETVDPAVIENGKKILIFNDKFVVATLNNNVFYVGEDKELHYFDYSYMSDAKVLNGHLVFACGDHIRLYPVFEYHYTLSLNAYAIDSRKDNSFWVAGGEEGLTCIKRMPDSNSFETTVAGLKINSPKRNFDFYMTYVADKLLITGGSRGPNRNFVPGTLMVLKDKKWFNFDEKSIEAKTGLQCLDFMSVAVDPRNSEHYFVASWGEGLYEFLDNEFVKLYTEENSSLISSVPGDNHYIRVDGVKYDRNNNLYMVNVAPYGLSVMLADGNWKHFYHSAIASTDINKIVIDQNNRKWLNIWRASKAGIAVLDDKGTIEDDSDDEFYYSSRFVDQQGYDVGATGYLDVAEDMNGTIWVGTDNGPIRFYSPQQVQEGVCNRPVSTDEYGTPFRLMEGLKVNAIVVDAANRKWLGTENAGLFVVDDQTDVGMMQVENYTVENSYIISNKITALAINDKTGEIFIGTDKGLCSYQMEATVGSDDYSEVHAFPNPVRPSSDSRVVISGLMNSSNIKITDMAGNLMKAGKSVGGQFVWNLTNSSGNIVKAGIYLVFASTQQGQQGVVTKVIVIK